MPAGDDLRSSPYIAALKAAGARRRAEVTWWQTDLGRLGAITLAGRLRVTYERRPSNSSMGRFGGGWQWKLGVQAGGHSVIVSLLVATVRFDWR